jgi:tetratricopeptide (TPR) repeat protein
MDRKNDKNKREKRLVSHDENVSKSLVARASARRPSTFKRHEMKNPQKPFSRLLCHLALIDTYQFLVLRHHITIFTVIDCGSLRTTFFLKTEMPKKQRPNSKKAKKARRKQQKKKDTEARLCTDLVTVVEEKEVVPLKVLLEKNQELLYGKKGLRHIRRAREQMTTTTLSTANFGNGTVTKEQAEAFRRDIAAKYTKRWNTMFLKCEDSDVGYTSVFRDISRIHRHEWKRIMGLDDLMLDSLAVYDHLGLVFYFRGCARKRSGDFDGAIDDLTLALETAFSASRYYCAGAFLERARCYRSKGDFDKAIVDFWACRAICLTSKVKEREEKCSGCEKELLETLILQAKQRNGSARPLFTKKQQYMIERDLSINSYNLKMYECENCGSTDLTTLVEQGFDTRCGSWYCSVRCQKQAWASGHKEVCDRCKPYFFQDSYRAIFEGKFDESDVVAGCLFDDISGRIFDGLTNRELFFLPSEVDLVPQKFKKVAESFLENLPNDQLGSS